VRRRPSADFYADVAARTPERRRASMPRRSSKTFPVERADVCSCRARKADRNAKPGVSSDPGYGGPPTGRRSRAKTGPLPGSHSPALSASRPGSPTLREQRLRASRAAPFYGAGRACTSASTWRRPARSVVAIGNGIVAGIDQTSHGAGPHT
jgi:hypothetical protein